jgi:cytochrome c553
MNILKRVQYGFVLRATVLLVTPFACAQVRSDPPAIIIRYCSGCHGLDGQSQLPYIPRLAGMGAPYLEARFASYEAAASPPVDEAFHRILHIGNPSKHTGLTSAAKAQMVGVAHVVSDENSKVAIRWYAAQQPTPGKSRKGKVIEEGRNLYINGLQSQGLPACQTCHGPAAQGTETAPRLAGQNAAYVFGQLPFSGRVNGPTHR